ncbi:MAG: DoxX family membrane protein [Rhodothermales bacterium]|nr:DoxX family membrane protein [Rhodothermales bacterium]
MSATRLLAWFHDHADIALDFVRVYLGVALFVRGVLFILEPTSYAALVSAAGEPTLATAALAHVVALAHLAGGLLLALGLLTRIAAFVQLPVLMGAAYVVWGQGLGAPNQSLELTFLVLFLLVLFCLTGAGRFSLDHLLFDRPEPQRSRERQLRLFGRDGEPVPAGGDGAARIDLDAVPATLVGSDAEPCIHGRDRHHPRVSVERDYGLTGGLRFLTGTTGRPRRIVFRCRDCDGVVEVSEAQEDLDRFMYREGA